MTQVARTWMTQVTLAAVAVGVVLAAPLATPNRAAADNITIAGARSLSDQVSVRYGTAKQAQTTDVHLLAFNDLHGNLEAAGNNIYGRFAGGAAYLAKAVKDKQALYGDNQATVFAGDNIGASPLQNGLFFEEPITIASNLMNVDFASVGNHEFDKGSAELQRIQNGGCHRLRRLHRRRPYALANGGDHRRLSRRRLPVPVGERGRGRDGLDALPGVRDQAFKSDSGKKFSVGFIGEVLEATPTIVTPTGVAGLTFQDEADAANRPSHASCRANVVDTWVLVIHEGGFQAGTAALNGCAGNLAGSDDRRHRQPARSGDQGDRLGAHPRRVPLHDHDERRDPPDHERCPRSGGSSPTSRSRSTTRPVSWSRRAPTNSIVENALNPRVDADDDPPAGHVEGGPAGGRRSSTSTSPRRRRWPTRSSARSRVTSPGPASPFGETTLGDVIADAQSSPRSRPLSAAPSSRS